MPRDRQLVGFALVTVVLLAALLAFAIHALREPRVSFPLAPKTTTQS